MYRQEAQELRRPGVPANRPHHRACVRARPGAEHINTIEGYHPERTSLPCPLGFAPGQESETMNAHSITMLGTGLIGVFYTMTLHGQRSRDQVSVVYSRSQERAMAFAAAGASPSPPPT